MKQGDLLLIHSYSHGYPLDWKRGQEPVKFGEDTYGIFLEAQDEEIAVHNPRTFYKVLTSRGIIQIFSGYTSEPFQELQA